MTSCDDAYAYDQEYKYSFEYYNSQLEREYDGYEHDAYEYTTEQEEPVHTMADVFQELLSHRFKIYYDIDLKRIDQKNIPW